MARRREMKKARNAGFSLVELIIVIAIMAILVGVLAPQFIKYVESSRRSKDIQNASQLKEAMLAEMADQEIDGSGTLILNPSTIAAFDGASLMAGSISADSIPTIEGNLANKGGYFYVKYDVVNGICDVYNDNPGGGAATTFCLTNAAGADDYKNAR
ncbi:MAG: type II secretion system GspH family protein [Lachnospiraceae bacterium]|nr:type II secretion system GspH family protein [Lachnospiraceae bacterium]